MTSIPALPSEPNKLSDNAEIRRVETLFQRLPSSIVAALIGILLVFFILFDVIGVDMLKAWAAFMLSTFALRTWLWYMFRSSQKHIDTVKRWEWAFAGGAFLTSLGWAALSGPLYPTAAGGAQTFVLLLTVAIAFTGSVMVATSNVTFWLFLVPTLFPIIGRYFLAMGHNVIFPVAVGVGCVAVFVIVQRTLYRFAWDNFQRNTDAESLLAEQQAIFQSSPLGIAVMHGDRIVKCNARLGELLGRRIQDINTLTIHQHFVSIDEAQQFLSDAHHAFEKGNSMQGMYRLRRADHSELWAEFSGRPMAGDTPQSVWMIADVTLREARRPVQ